MRDYILVIDFGSQYSQLIARRLRDLGYYSLLHGPTQAAPEYAPRGIILSGGPSSAREANAPVVPDWVWAANRAQAMPILGICYGMQHMAETFGGEVAESHAREFGRAMLNVLAPNALLWQADNAHTVWMSHGDHVAKLPDGFERLADSSDCAIAAMADTTRHLYGVQFHPEVSHTEDGGAIFENFCTDICNAAKTWHTADIVDEVIANIQRTVGDARVLLGLSGGVDSAVSAALIHRAIGDRLTCLFIDNGLLRKNELDHIRALPFEVEILDAKAAFFSALKGVAEPEAKRKIIGAAFIRAFETHTRAKAKTAPYQFLAQGTIYPDVIESAGLGNHAHVIKSHHNVGGLPERLNFQILEPLRDLFKDEVRRMGAHLGLPKALLSRHPFPGPGLGVRILGEVSAERVHVLQEADAIFLDCLHEYHCYDKVSQAFAVFMPVKSVGVVGDARRYADVIALRAVETVDFMTARWAHLPYDIIDTAATRIINRIPEISRVVYDVSNKPPATIEWE